MLLSGPATVTIKEWMAPTLGSRPHDSHAAADGSIWWTGQFANKLGRLDPRTGQIREFDLPANSQPHGLAEDAQGNIWYTGIQKGVIGRLDPKTGRCDEYPLNEPGARGPHTPILDKRSGNLFFTLQSGHVGRLNTASGEMVIKKTPSDNTYPYGIRLNSQGVPWYVDFRGNRIGSVDPRTMEIKEFTLPNADARPRRLTITPDDVIYYTDFARGMLGRFDPKTGQVKEWPSPGGPDSEPYAITPIGDIVWYSESGVRPNTMVRFDPQTREVPDVRDPVGRRRAAPLRGDARRQHRHRQQRREQDRAGRDRHAVEQPDQLIAGLSSRQGPPARWALTVSLLRRVHRFVCQPVGVLVELAAHVLERHAADLPCQRAAPRSKSG